MRFGMLMAAAGALLCAGQAKAARYYEFVVTSRTTVPSTTTQVTEYVSTITTLLDSTVAGVSGIYAYGNNGLYISLGLASLYTTNSGNGSIFNIVVDKNSLTSQFATLSGSVGYRDCTRVCTDYSGSLIGAVGRTFDTPPVSPIARETLTVSQVSLPEPATWALMILGIAAIGYATRYRRIPARLAAS